MVITYKENIQDGLLQNNLFYNATDSQFQVWGNAEDREGGMRKVFSCYVILIDEAQNFKMLKAIDDLVDLNKKQLTAIQYQTLQSMLNEKILKLN